jgi:biopolymer transport protein ExbD
MHTLRRRNATLPAVLITPLIDVIMCLLIVFMVIQPGMRRGMDLQVPNEKRAEPGEAPADVIVLHVLPDSRYAINDVPVDSAQLGRQLRAIFALRPRKVLFIKGDGGVTYERVVDAVDVARGAGIDVVGLSPRQSHAVTAANGGAK